MSAKAVEQLVKFVYGFDIDIDLRSFVVDNDDWKALKELLIYGGVYGLDELQKAAENHLKNHLIYVNVIQFLEFAKEEKLYGTIKICAEFAARYNDQMICSDLSKETIIKHPEIAIEMVENRNILNNNANSYNHGTLICFDSLTPYELRVNSAEEQKVQMTIGVNHSITITALGLSVLPGSKFSVRAHIKKNTNQKKSSSFSQ